MGQLPVARRRLPDRRVVDHLAGFLGRLRLDPLLLHALPDHGALELVPDRALRLPVHRRVYLLGELHVHRAQGRRGLVGHAAHDWAAPRGQGRQPRAGGPVGRHVRGHRLRHHDLRRILHRQGHRVEGGERHAQDAGGGPLPDDEGRSGLSHRRRDDKGDARRGARRDCGQLPPAVYEQERARVHQGRHRRWQRGHRRAPAFKRQVLRPEDGGGL
mmetsp:Transcript_28721/g.101728  ORF Transcript_28721/g.101728 Transcript_28721/m.101728 type:complete len:215 (+) Transcript_28721:660-1304(+)